jgi:hypothetical protein
MPVNERLDDGFSTIITLANIPTVKLFEKGVTPPGITAGGPIDTTTMRNITWRTMSPKVLKSLTPVSATVAFATNAIPVVQGQIGHNQLITITFPDLSTLVFWGWLEEFSIGALSEGEQPTATIKIQPGNIDNDKNEVAPHYTPPLESSGGHH